MFKFFYVIFSFFCLCGCRATMPQNSVPHNTPELINLNINGLNNLLYPMKIIFLSLMTKENCGTRKNSCY